MKHEFISVREIFNKYKLINVPYYQRDYVWGSKNEGRNLYKFIDDIFTQFKDNQSTDYFIGTLAFCSAKVNDVIDGQQRLTSLILILTILADNFCSEDVKNQNKQLIMPDGKFIIQEEFYLTEELKSVLGIRPNTFNPTTYTVKLSETFDRILSQINRGWSGFKTEWYDSLYNYILDKVKVISLEYNNISESLKYFLNINSLSIQLTQSDIFFSILSQSIRISGGAHSIFTIKQKVSAIAEWQGIGRDIDGYKAYNSTNRSEKGVDNVIYIFLNAFYQHDSNILSLNETGIGKWMSFYKNEVFNDPIKALEFTNNFLDFLKDLEAIYKYLSNLNVSLDKKSSIYVTWILLQYESYIDILSVLIKTFKYRHNYIKNYPNLYKSDTDKTISIDKLNDIGKRLNLTLLWNYINGNNKHLDGLEKNIDVELNGDYKKSIPDIIGDINMHEIFTLSYNDKKGSSKVKISDDSRFIKVIFSLQESYLNFVANPSRDISEYIQDILLTQNFSIEHLLSIEEYNDKTRLSNWNNKKGKFTRDVDFDTERYRFENLSLLNSASNASAGTDNILDKMKKYKNARKICTSEWEYLIQSLVPDSEFYRNAAIQGLGLPDRTLCNIDQNTWELSPNNRKFNVDLLKKALDELVKK